MDHKCKYDDRIIEMSENIRELLTEFKSMNGKLIDTKRNFDKHSEESVYFRRKVTDMWAILHTVKWTIALVFGAGLAWRAITWVLNLL